MWSLWCLSLPGKPSVRGCRRRMHVLLGEVAGLPVGSLQVLNRRVPTGPPPFPAMIFCVIHAQICRVEGRGPTATRAHNPGRDLQVDAI